MRYAVRDAARHRTRTVPAVAAVAATVAGVVALGIANASDAAQNRETYQPQLPAGDGVGHRRTTRTPPSTGPVRPRSSIASCPDATVTPVRGIVEGRPTGESAYLEFRVPGAGTDGLLDELRPSLRGVGAGQRRGLAGRARVRRGCRRAACSSRDRGRAAWSSSAARPVDQREVKITGFAVRRRGERPPDPSRDGAGDVRRGGGPGASASGVVAAPGRARSRGARRGDGAGR